jgi:hypothetical protein
MKISVLHDRDGEIIALSKVGDLGAVGSKFTQVGMQPGEGQNLLEIELSEEQERKSLLELHNEHRVDLSTSKLARKG